MSRARSQPLQPGRRRLLPRLPRSCCKVFLLNSPLLFPQVIICVAKKGKKREVSRRKYAKKSRMPNKACTRCTLVIFTPVGFSSFSVSSSNLLSSHYSPRAPSHSTSNNSDSGSHRGPCSPRSTTVRAFVFIARIQHLPSSNRVELCLPTLLIIGVLSR